MNKKDYLSLQPGDKVRLHKAFTERRATDDSGFSWSSLAPGDSLAERLSGKTVTVKRLDDKKRGTLVIETDGDYWFITRRLIRKKLEPEATAVSGPAESEPTKAAPPPGYRLLAYDEVILEGDLWWSAPLLLRWEPAAGVIGCTLKKLQYASYPERHAEFVNRSACRKIPADDPKSNVWRDMGPDEVLRGGDYFLCAHDWQLVIGLDGTSVRHTYSQRGRRKVVRYEPAPQYRLLDDGETILETDRFGFAEIPSSETLLRAPRDWMGSSINPIVGETPRAVRGASDWFGQFFVVREHPE